MAKGICALLNKKEQEVYMLTWSSFLAADYAFTGTTKYLLHTQNTLKKHWNKLHAIVKKHKEIRWVILDIKYMDAVLQATPNCFFVSLEDHESVLEKNLCNALNELTINEKELIVDVGKDLQSLRKALFEQAHDDFEIKIFALLNECKPENEIAPLLNVSVRTYQRKQKELAEKIDVANRRELLVKYALENGIIEINKNGGDELPFNNFL